MVVSRSIIIYFLGKLIPAISSLLFMFLGLRYLGKSEFGKYNLLFNASAVISTFLIGWIQQSILRFSSGGENDLAPEKNFFRRVTALLSWFAFTVMFLIALI